MYTIPVHNPSNGTVVKNINASTEQQIHEAYAKAKLKQPSWGGMPVQERIDIIKTFAALLEKHKDALAKDLTTETGKPLQQSYNELKGALHRIRYFTDHAARYLADEKLFEGNGMEEILSYEPLGLVANISAWNYPYLVGVNVWIPALLAGNAVLYKPSEYALLTGLHVTKLMHEAGVPNDVFACIIGDGSAGKALIDLPLDGYFFTGSYGTGQTIKKALADKMVPVQLELGGKDPLYVMDDVADIQKTAEAVLEGIMYNAGQSCCAVERVYVQEGVYDQFVTAIKEEAEKIQTGEPMQPGIGLGPICREAQLQVLQQQVEDAIHKGAYVVYRQPAIPEKGYYFPLTLLADTNHSMTLMMEESFGPVCGIQKVRDDEEALKLMCDTEYGLTAAVYGTDIQRAEKIMHAINTGTVYFNCCDRVSPYAPWSGRGHSGVGHTLSYHGIRAFTKMKAWHWRKG